MLKKSVFILGCFASACLPLAGLAGNTSVPYANSTWVHDLDYDSVGNATGATPGYFFNKLQAYNKGAAPGHAIGMVFTYIGHIQLVPDPKTNKLTPVLDYYPAGSGLAQPKNTWVASGNNGIESLHRYAKLTLNGQPGGKPILNFADVVAALDSTDPADLKGIHRLNTLNKKEAIEFADNVAKKICADKTIDGVLFDIEPFTFKGSDKSGMGQGQEYFYTEVAKALAGHHNSGAIDKLNCRNADHPNGRYFATVASASAIKGAAKQVADIFNKYGNGFMIVPTHAISHLHNGVAIDPKEYQAGVKKQAAIMVKLADQYGIAYQFVIPASAVENTFECNKSPKTGCKYSGYDQIDYVKGSIDAINQSGARSDPLFKGIALYAFSRGLFIHQNILEPSDPTLDRKQLVVPYLQKNL